MSYTRFDDRHDGGAISEFRLRLSSAVRAVTGRPFEIFQDIDGIGLGEKWLGKLDQILDQARFFIPIVTPSYFLSAACRDELERFLRAEAARGRSDIVLPIYYVECDVLEDPDLRRATLWRVPSTSDSGRIGAISDSSHSQSHVYAKPSKTWRGRLPARVAVRRR